MTQRNYQIEKSTRSFAYQRYRLITGILESRCCSGRFDLADSFRLFGETFRPAGIPARVQLFGHGLPGGKFNYRSKQRRREGRTVLCPILFRSSPGFLARYNSRSTANYPGSTSSSAHREWIRGCSQPVNSSGANITRRDCRVQRILSRVSRQKAPG